MSRQSRLRNRNAALADAAEEINTGVIGADEVYGTVHGLGCEWETLMVVHVDGVSFNSGQRAALKVFSEWLLNHRLPVLSNDHS